MNEDTRRNPDGPECGTGFQTEIGQSETAMEAVTRALSAIQGVGVTDLDRLYDDIEPDALEQLVEHAEARDRYLEVEFTYEGYTVAVRGWSVVCVTDRSTRTEEDAREE